MKIIRPVRVEQVAMFYLQFDDPNGPGGWGFPCKEDGTVIMEELSEIARANLQKARTSGVRPIIQDCSSSYRHCAIGVCDNCDKQVHLSSSWANACQGCGTEYNGSGQRLSPRRFWGEETGETF